jgi:hypothetical protein
MRRLKNFALGIAPDKLPALLSGRKLLADPIETGVKTESIAQPTALSRLLRIFAPAASIPIKSNDPIDISRQYRYWQKRVLLTSIIGYATFYFVRKNLSIAMPVMQSSLGFKKTHLGLFLTLHGLLYGVSKFANGFLGDRANARAFMAFGLAASALMNVFFGFNSAVVTLGLIWMANGWFQGMVFRRARVCWPIGFRPGNSPAKCLFGISRTRSAAD